MSSNKQRLRKDLKKRKQKIIERIFITQNIFLSKIFWPQKREVFMELNKKMLLRQSIKFLTRKAAIESMCLKEKLYL